MMCRIVLLVFFVVHYSSHSQSQIAFYTGYEYLKADEWDHIVQTFNFARPWNENVLVPLTHGIEIAPGYTFLLSHWGEVRLRPSLGYHYWSAGNKSNGTFLSLQQFEFSIPLCFSPRALFREYNAGPLGPRWFVELTSSFSGWMPLIRNDGEIQKDKSGELYRPISTSFNASIGTGYHFLYVGRFIITPKISLGWSSQVELEDFAETMNGTNQNQMENSTAPLLTFKGGLLIHLTSKDKSWWNRP